MKKKKGMIDKRLLIIRDLVSDITGIDDFICKSRERPLPFIRFVFMKLCKDNTQATLAQIGEVCGERDHATVRCGLLKFDELKGEGFFKPYLQVFKDAQEQLSNEELANREDFLKKSPSSSADLYNDRVCDVISNQRQQINILKRTLKTLKQESVFKKIASLDEIDFKDFLTRADAFFEMKRIKEKYKLNI